MQHHKTVEDYLNTVIPKELSEDKKSELRAEIECHIYDRADFYIEIGYDEATAFEKAVEQMGEAEPVKTNFNALYCDSTLKAFLLFFGICTWNLMAITAELGYMYFVDPIIYSLPSIAVLAVFLVAFVLLIVYTIKCSRQKLRKQLTGIVAAFALISFGSFITSGIFFPIINAGKLVIRYVTTFLGSGNDSDIYFANIISVILFTVLSFRAYNKVSAFRKKPYRLSLKKITAIVSAGCLCFLTVYGFAFEKYGYWPLRYQSRQECYQNTEQENFTSNITAEQRKVYVSIKKDDDIKVIEKILAENGFKKYSDSYEKYLNDNYSFSFDVDEKLNALLKENTEDNSYIFYYYVNPTDEENPDEFDDVISCILVSYGQDGKVKSKYFIDDSNNTTNLFYLSDVHGKEAADWFSNINQGDDSETAMEYIRTTGARIFEGEKYTNGNTYTVYEIYLNCCYMLDVDLIDIIFNSGPDSVDTSHHFEIRAENGVITDLTVYEGLLY